MKSPMYWNSTLHEILKKIIRRKKDKEIFLRYEKISKWIPNDSSVLDVAAGTARIYRKHLYKKVNNYTAIEINKSFVKKLKSIGIPVIHGDIRNIRIPKADIIIMIAALYHFQNIENIIIEKLLNAAYNKLIIVEPNR